MKFASQSAIGNATIYGNDLGRAWGPLLDQIALWAEDKAACLPFMARVLKIEKNLIYLDAGAEAQLSAEDSLHLHTWQEPPVRATTNLLLGQEKRARGVARLKAIYPGFSIAELIKAPIGLNVRSGDLFYAQ